MIFKVILSNSFKVINKFQWNVNINDNSLSGYLWIAAADVDDEVMAT